MYRKMEKQDYFMKQRKAVVNDPLRKELFRKLFELYANSLPIALKKQDGSIECSHSDEVEDEAEKIRELIRQRDDQLFKTLFTT